MKLRGWMVVAIVWVAGAAQAEVRLPMMLSDHAVLQRGAPVHVWGWSSPEAHLTARFHQQTVEARADERGQWSLYLAPEQGGGPYTLTVSGDGPDKMVSDLLVGDVWFASGQSNMEMPLNGFPPNAVVKDAAAEIAAAKNAKLRLLLVEHKTSDVPLNDITTSWTECTPATAATFSAVAYFFGREIAAKENVPVGLVDATWGEHPRTRGSRWTRWGHGRNCFRRLQAERASPRHRRISRQLWRPRSARMTPRGLRESLRRSIPGIRTRRRGAPPSCTTAWLRRSRR